MDHFAGLDVSVKETSVCILDDAGKILKEVKVASEPQALLKVLGNPAYRFKRIGLEAGPLSQSGRLPLLLSLSSESPNRIYSAMGERARCGGLALLVIGKLAIARIAPDAPLEAVK